jgi:hypothetical protein
MNVEWTESATAQLQAIRDYLARTSPGYAQALAERIVRRTEGLAAQPFLGSAVTEDGDEALREVGGIRAPLPGPLSGERRSPPRGCDRACLATTAPHPTRLIPTIFVASLIRRLKGPGVHHDASDHLILG